MIYYLWYIQKYSDYFCNILIRTRTVRQRCVYLLQFGNFI